MTRLTRLISATALCLALPFAAQADANRAAISDQSYKGGKYSAASGYAVWNNCPREYRGMYRGDLYCRKPAYQVLQYRHPSCPKGFRGMYRGDLYCFGRP